MPYIRISHLHCMSNPSSILIKLYFSSVELIVYQSSRRPSVRPSTLLNINISETSGPIATKFYLKHYLGGRKAVLCFGPDRIGTLVSMATYSSNRVIMGKTSLAL